MNLGTKRINSQAMSIVSKVDTGGNILCAEDDWSYADLLLRAFKKSGLHNPIHVVQNGAEAIAYLKGEGKYEDRQKYPMPGLVLVDLKMPMVNGFEVLEWIRTKSDVPHIPVVVLTSSGEVRDIKKAYDLGANSFLSKPCDPDDLMNMMKSVEHYWLHYNKS